jgi:hypothetical protein
VCCVEKFYWKDKNWLRNSWCLDVIAKLGGERFSLIWIAGCELG